MFKINKTQGDIITLKDLSKWKMCSLMVAFIFFFNTTGLAGLAIASNLPQSESSDSALFLGQKIQEVSTSLKLIKNDINSGNNPAAHLDDLSQQYEEIDQLSGLISAELGEVQTEVADLVEQGTLTSEFLGRSTDFANHYHQNITIILGGINEILNASQVSVEQVDNVLNNIKELSPEVKANILGSKNGPELTTRRSDIPRRGPTLKSDRTTDVLPVEGDITASTDVRITPEIEELAGELNHDVKEIFSYVRNTIDYQPYYGSVKGSVGTYWEKAGNDFDQSSFLIALLRASDIPARYVAGEVGLPIRMVMNWVGVETAEAAIEVFASIGIPSEAIESGSGKIIGLKFYHVWVEAYNSHDRWVGMDPSFKQYRYHDGIDINAATDLDVDTLYNSAIEGAVVGNDYVSGLNEINLVADLNTYKNNLMSYIETNMPGATIKDIIGYREIVQKAKGILPPPHNGGVFGISETKERFSEIPHSMRYLVNFQVSGINYSIAIPSIAEESIIVSYVPATQYDENLIESYGGIFNVPAYLIHMRPVLKIDGEIVAEGSSLTLGASQTLYSSFSRPESGTWSTNSRGLTVGATYSLNLDIQRVSLDLIEKRGDSLGAIVDNYPSDAPATQAMIEEALHLTGLAYFAEVDVHSDIAAQTQKVVWVRLPSQAIVAQEVVVSYFFWFPWKISHRSIDVKRNILNPVSVTGNQADETAWMISVGVTGSATEHTIFESLYDVDSVSTIKILALANKQGIPVYHVDSTNVDTVLPQLNTYSIVKDSIRSAVEKGWVAMCPQRNITLNDWNGQGWIIMNPDSGAAGYLLAGRLISGSTIEMTNGGSTSKPTKKYITGYLIGDFLLLLHHWKAIIITGYLMVPGCLYAIYLTLMYGTLIELIACPFIFLGGAFLLFVVLFAIIYARLPHIQIVLRRRETMYAKVKYTEVAYA
jgi:transglutaminase-like putative cysteine protease